jgi:hypothetical protein
LLVIFFLILSFSSLKSQTLPPVSVSINHYNQDQHILDDQAKTIVSPGTKKDLHFRKGFALQIY